jgi:alpha-beta hydrolase superfamily lysophospholipase
MDEKRVRIKRIDRIGSTASVPSTRTLEEVKSQRWIADRFFRLMGRSCFFWDNPEEAVGAGVVRGANYFDLKDTAARIKCLDEYPKENIRTAGRLEKLGKREEGAGHTETACDYYFRACQFYVSAAWGIFDSENEELVWITDRITSTFDGVIRYSRYPMERVEIPFEGTSLPGILTLTPERKKAPTILLVPGMDLHKENVTNHLNNAYVARGMNTLAIDGPGQGESLLRKIWVDEDNYGRAGRAAIDFLVKRPEVDANRIGLHGTSMGTYWGPLIAIEDSRVKALSTYASCQYDKDHIFNETSPNFRLRFMWMAGNLDDEEFDRMAARMTLEGRESRITCPHIIFHGEFDHLTDTEEVHRYFDRLGSEIKELRIYENEYHGISRFTDEVASMSADFLRDRLNGVPPKEKRRIVYVDWNRMEHRVDEDRIRRGFSDLVAETS